MITHTDCDAAELPQASACDHPADHTLEAYCPRCNRGVDACCPSCRSHLEPAGASSDGSAGSELPRMEFYRRFANLIQMSRDTKFTMQCYLIATGDAYADGVSLTEVAKKNGVTKALVSKQCHFICVHLGIQPSRYMKSETQCAKHRVSNVRPRKI